MPRSVPSEDKDVQAGPLGLQYGVAGFTEWGVEVVALPGGLYAQGVAQPRTAHKSDFDLTHTAKVNWKPPAGKEA